MNTSRQQTDFDIAIVGGGMVGASLACSLAATDLRIALLDGVKFDPQNIPFNDPAAVFDPRVSAISPASKLWLEEIGAWQEIAATRAMAYTNMEVWDADGTGSIHFAARDINQPELGHIIENSIILSSLYNRLSQIPQVSLLAPARVESLENHSDRSLQSVLLTTEDHKPLTASLVIGADGPNSKVRQLAGIETRQWDYQHQAIVTSVRTELPHQSRALQRFMSSGPLAFLPLMDDSSSSVDDQHYCSIVWSAVPDRAEQLMKLSDAEFADVLAENIEHKLGAIQWLDKRFAFPLRQRHAVDYVQRNIALVGDAAHTIHPLAGQGVNLGFLDVKALSNEIILNLKNRRPHSEFKMLRRYQRQRIGHNLSIMWMMEGFKLLFAEQALPLIWLRNAGLSGTDRLPLIKNRIMRQAMGI